MNEFNITTHQIRASQSREWWSVPIIHPAEWGMHPPNGILNEQKPGEGGDQEAPCPAPLRNGMSLFLEVGKVWQRCDAVRVATAHQATPCMSLLGRCEV